MCLRGVTAIEDVGVKRLTKMTSGESFDSNAVETNGINIEREISDQSIFPTRVYAIPKNQKGANTLMKLPIRIANNTSTPLHLNRYQPLIPEVLASDGQIIQRLLVTDESVASTQLNTPQQLRPPREPQQWQLPPGYGASISQTARLCWQNNLLQLQIPTRQFGSNKFWLFDALQPGNYQLRFVLNIDRETTPVAESDHKVFGTGSGILATPFLNLHLIQPLSTDSSAIEVNGVQFKTEIPDTVLTIPPNLPDASTHIKLGIRATNKTSTALYFEQMYSFSFTLLDDDGKDIQFTDTRRRLRVDKGPKPYLVEPGESALFVCDGTLDWLMNQLLLAIPNKAGGNCLFAGLKPGKYQIQLIYHISELMANYLNEHVLEKVWTGWIALPFLEFHLVER